jgi:hypothetical protein
MTFKEYLVEKKIQLNEWNEEESKKIKHPKGFEFDVIYDSKLDTTKIRIRNRAMNGTSPDIVQISGKLSKKELMKQAESFWKEVNK